VLLAETGRGGRSRRDEVVVVVSVVAVADGEYGGRTASIVSGLCCLLVIVVLRGV